MKAIVLKLQHLKRNRWEPVAAKFFDVNNGVNTSTLTEFFAIPCKPSYRILVEERAMRHVPGAPVNVEDLFAAVRDFNTAVSRAISEQHRKPNALAQTLNEQRGLFQQWCESVGLQLDFNPKSEVTSE